MGTLNNQKKKKKQNEEKRDAMSKIKISTVWLNVNKGSVLADRKQRSIDG